MHQTVRNTSKTKNEVFVAYEGRTQYTGRFYQVVCRSDDGGRGGHTVKVYGRYKTFGASGDGDVLCGGGSGGSALVKAALAYCR